MTARRMTKEDMQERASALAAAMPPLTRAQRDRLYVLLRPNGTEDRRKAVKRHGDGCTCGDCRPRKIQWVDDE